MERPRLMFKFKNKDQHINFKSEVAKQGTSMQFIMSGLIDNWIKEQKVKANNG